MGRWRSGWVVTATLALAACADPVTVPTVVPTPAPPLTPFVPACSARPDAEAVLALREPGPASSQDAACRSNEPPRFENVVARRSMAGVEVTFHLVDPDSGAVCDVTYMNGRWRGAACGGTGGPLSTFSNNQTFPVEVRLVAWDHKGCLALPVCVTVR